MSLASALVAGALRRLEPERAHEATLRALELGLAPRGAADDPVLATELCGLHLANPVGLAAGFDKDARVFPAMFHLGFGLVECGTVTPRPQAGNPRPRLFRLPQERAVINRMGFNNAGLDAFAARVTPWDRAAGAPLTLPPRAARRDRAAGALVANIGANKDSADRVGDYVTGLERLWPLADGLTVNVSSPNTPGLRALQSGAALDELGERLAAARARLRREAGGDGPPLFLKVAPDLDEGEIEAIAGRAARHGFDALVVSNTTSARPPGLAGRHAGETGGLSGAPLAGRAAAVLRLFAAALADGPVRLVAAGGIASGADALARIRAGASAVQLYTALVYAGPGLVAEIKRDLAARLRAEGFGSVREAVGAG